MSLLTTFGDPGPGGFGCLVLKNSIQAFHSSKELDNVLGISAVSENLSSILEGESEQVLLQEEGGVQVIMQQEGETRLLSNVLGINDFQNVFIDSLYDLQVIMQTAGLTFENLNVLELGSDIQISSNVLGTGDAQELLSSIVVGRDFQKILSVLGTGIPQVYPNVLGVGDKQVLWIPFMQEQVQSILNSLDTRFNKVQKIINRISASDIDAQVQVVKVPIQGIDEIFKALNQISDAYVDVQRVINSIGIPEMKATQEIINVICDVGISETQKIISAIDQVGNTITTGKIGAGTTQEVGIFLDGVDITEKLVGTTTITLFPGSFSSISMNIATETVLTGTDLDVVILGVHYYFTVENLLQDVGNKSLVISGKVRQGQIADPYQKIQDFFFKEQYASEIAEELCSPYTLVWDCSDFYIKMFVYKETTPFEVLIRLAEVIGAEVRCMPDQKIYVVDPYITGPSQFDLSWALTFSRTKQLKQYDGVKVIFGKDADSILMLECDKTELDPYEIGEIRVYATGSYTISVGGMDKYWKYASDVPDDKEIRQWISFEEKETVIALSKPVVAIIEVEGCSSYSFEGQRIYCPGECKAVWVRYTTKHDLWKCTRYSEGQGIFCAVETEQESMVLSGTGNRILEIEEPLIQESRLARERAENELVKYSSFWKSSVTVPYEADLADPYGRQVTDPYKETSTVVSSKILITNNPLRVKSLVECIPIKDLL